MKATVKFIQSLGWHETELFNSRTIYSLGEEQQFYYYLFEHNGNIGILVDNEFIYTPLDEDKAKQYTELAKLYELIWKQPKDYTVFQLQELQKDMLSFTNNVLEREKEIVM